MKKLKILAIYMDFSRMLPGLFWTNAVHGEAALQVSSAGCSPQAFEHVKAAIPKESKVRSLSKLILEGYGQKPQAFTSQEPFKLMYFCKLQDQCN
jgi:hypothetical protein